MERFVELRTKLDHLRRRDPKFNVFGSRRVGNDGHAYREQPVLDDAGLAHLEAASGVALPDEVRSFLQRLHAGGAGPGYGLHVFGDPARTARPFPYGRSDFDALIARRRHERYACLALTEEHPDDEWPPGPGFVSIAQHGCGVTDVLVVTGELTGSIWCCDMAWRPYATGERPSTFLDWYEAWLDRSLELATG